MQRYDYLTVAVCSYIDQNFEYRCPDNDDIPKRGMFVLVPLGKNDQLTLGLILSVSKESKFNPQKIKTAGRLFTEIPLLPETLLKCAEWMKEYYGTPLGMIVGQMVPKSLFKDFKRLKISLKKTSKEKVDSEFSLNDDQLFAYEKIKKHLFTERSNVFLLWGVTGSGKTEVYLRLIEMVLSKGQSVLLIVPEISLTPQLIELFKKRFSQNCAVFHSKMKNSDRKKNWILAAQGKIKIVIGARSAVFAPLKNCGLIIVDEEHERSFKQDEAPRYNGRDIAVLRSSIENSQVLLCSATPSMESYHNALTGKYHLLKLKNRVMGRSMADVKVVDMDLERKMRKKSVFFSKELLDALSDKISKKEQSIIFLNRRGFSTSCLCKECGFVLKCDHCSIMMTYHRKENSMVCHRCDYKIERKTFCPQCRQPALSLVGFGTQKIEESLKKILPEAKIARIDTDTVKRKGSFEQIWKEFMTHEIDILIGTQMIAKGLNIPNVTLVGVISADLSLNIPDFRSGEQTFQLLTQVAGRAGRGEKKGEVIVQTYQPDHPIIQCAINQDYLSFYQAEIELRKDLNYPPYYHFILITVQYRDEVIAAKIAHGLHQCIDANPYKKIKRLFPAVPASIEKIKSNYRFQLLISTQFVKHTVKILNQIIQKDFYQKKRNILIDVDPYTIL